MPSPSTVEERVEIVVVEVEVRERALAKTWEERAASGATTRWTRIEKPVAFVVVVVVEIAIEEGEEATTKGGETSS